MARIHKQRRSTAAYKASQPLFDVLRIGVDRLDEQKNNLTVSRDLVQATHVKIKHENDEKELSQHDRYAACAVKAWQSATDMYEAIFFELAEVTAADRTVGKQADHGHKEFVAMLQTATEAKTIASRYVRSAKASGSSFPTAPTTSNSSASDFEEPASAKPASQKGSHTAVKRSAPVDEASPAMAEQPPSKIQRLGKTAEDVGSGPKTSGEVAAESSGAPNGSSRVNDKKAKKRQDRQERRKRAAASKRTASKTDQTKATQAENDHVVLNGAALETQPLSGPTQTTQVGSQSPHVEYEDVSAEVDARLKAKEEAKKAKKEAKKRKRESVTSVAEAEPEPIDALEAALLERPKTKKQKADANDGVGAAPEKFEKKEKKEKRKKDIADGEAKVEPMSKKRKKLTE